MHIGTSFQHHSKWAHLFFFFFVVIYLFHRVMRVSTLLHAHTFSTKCGGSAFFRHFFYFALLRRLAGRNKSRSTYFFGYFTNKIQWLCICGQIEWQREAERDRKSAGDHIKNDVCQKRIVHSYEQNGFRATGYISTWKWCSSFKWFLFHFTII